MGSKVMGICPNMIIYTARRHVQVHQLGTSTMYHDQCTLSSGALQLYNELISYTKQFSAIEPKNYFI